MPTYQYACTECGERLEVVQKFTDDALTVCPACEGRLRKLFSPVGVVFKGSGFYKTDSRGSGSSSSSTAKSDQPSSGEKTPAAESKPSTSAAADSSGSSGSSSGSASGSAGSSGDGTKVA